MIEIYDDTRYSLDKDIALSHKVIHVIIVFVLAFSFKGFLLGGFSEYRIESNTAGLLYLSVGMLSFGLLYIMKLVNRYPFIFVSISIIMLSIVNAIIGVDGNGPLIILGAVTFFLITYISLILASDFENPTPKKFNDSQDDSISDEQKSISGFVYKGEFNKLAIGMAFGKAFLLGITGMNLIMSAIEILW